MEPTHPALRLATPADGPELAALYRPYVEETTISFEEVAPSGPEMAARISLAGSRHPWVVAVDGSGAVLGYAASGPHRPRAAYRWTVEVGIYVRRGAHRSGVGRRLYGGLLAILGAQGYATAHAGVTQPNPASLAFHEALGFSRIGRFEAVGYKHGAWRDVVWLARRLRALEDAPADPVDAAALDLRALLLGG